MPLLSASRRASSLSPPLPVNNSILTAHGVHLRRKQFTLLVGGSGVGKSVFARNLAVRTKVPTLFFSADSDEWTVKTSVCALLTGQPLEKVSEQLNEPNGAWDPMYAEFLQQANHIDWAFHTDLEPEYLGNRILAYKEIHDGEFPQLIVVDNLVNAVMDEDREMQELRATARDLQRIARSFNAHVLALHHVTGAFGDGFEPITLSAVKYKISEIPETVLGLSFGPGSDRITLTAPKLRGGRRGLTLHMPMDYSTATVGGWS